MKKFTISVAVASIFAGSLFAGDHGMMKMDKEECFKMHKEAHVMMEKEKTNDYAAFKQRVDKYNKLMEKLGITEYEDD